MTQKYKSALCVSLLSLFSASSQCSKRCITTFFSPRSQSVDLVRQVVGTREIEEQLKCSDDCWPGYIADTFEFTKSFRSHRISDCLFGDYLINNGCCQAIKISGSCVEGRDDEKDLLADYFGLPTDFQSIVNFNPRITNVIGDIQGYFRLDRWLCGLWFYIHAPIVHTKWNLNVCEDVVDAGSKAYREGYFAPFEVPRDNLLNNFSEFISGQKTPDLSGVFVVDGVQQSLTEQFNPLEWSRWAIDPCDSRAKTTLADLRWWVVYDWLNCDCYSLSAGIVVAAPTGNRPEGRFLFEPIAGNGKHWEVGGLIRGHYVVWEDCHCDHNVSLFTQANVTHLFTSKQTRTFDLCGKPLSRYALAEKMQPNAGVLFSSPFENSCTNLTQPSHQFAQEYTPVANLTTFCVDISAAAQVDWVAMATYTRCNLTWDVGYNLWYRSCEKLDLRDCDCNNLIPKDTWALKGDVHTYGFAADENSVVKELQPVSLSATQSDATIHFGGNRNCLLDPFEDNFNPNVDNAQFAVAGGGGDCVPLLNNTEDVILIDQIKTSNPPVFLKSEDVDLCCGRTRGFTNKIFTHVSYFWDCECWQPFFGVGAMGEFATKDSRKDCVIKCDNNNNNNNGEAGKQKPTFYGECRKCALSQWGVWIKGGFVFG